MMTNACMSYYTMWQIITVTVMSHERHGIPNHHQVNCFLISLLRLTTKKPSKVCITGPLWGESTGHQWPVDFPHKGPVVRKDISCCDPIMTYRTCLCIQHIILIHGDLTALLNHYLNQWWHSLMMHICVPRPQWVKSISKHFTVEYLLTH